MCWDNRRPSQKLTSCDTLAVILITGQHCTMWPQITIQPRLYHCNETDCKQLKTRLPITTRPIACSMTWTSDHGVYSRSRTQIQLENMYIRIDHSVAHLITRDINVMKCITSSFSNATMTSISAIADGPRDAASRKIDHIALPTEYN